MDLEELSVEPCHQCLHLQRINIFDDDFLVLFETAVVVNSGDCTLLSKQTVW